MTSTMYSLTLPTNNREYHWRNRCIIIEWCVEIKHNPHNAESEGWAQKKQHKWHPSTTQLFSILIKLSVNKIGSTGATSLSDALKSNTTLTKLNLSGEKSNTQMAFINNSLFFHSYQTTDNWIGYTGAASLSDALKTNTTLTELDLSREHERNDT